MLIDFHTHCFPNKLVARAMEVLERNSGNIQPQTDGTADGILRHLDQHGLDKAVVLNIATNPKQQHNVNDFAAAINSQRLIAFGSVHPDAPDCIDELYRIREMGLKGIKLHPEYQNFYVDADKMLNIYETADKLDLIVSFHAGVDIQYFEPVHNTPERMAHILPAFTKGRVVAAHMGGWQLWHEVEKHLVGKNLYLDTAFCYANMPAPHAKRIVKRHGADKILFGSDLPWSSSGLTRRFVESWGLSPDEYAAVMGGNAARLLGLTE